MADADIDLYADADLDNEFSGAYDDVLENVDLYDDVIAPVGSGVSKEPLLKEKKNGDANPPLQHRDHSGRRVAMYIGNLTWWTTDQDITDVIQRVGVQDMLDVKFFENRSNGQSKGFCLVTLGSDASFKTLMERLPKEDLHGQNPIVTPCTRASLNQFEAASRKPGEGPPRDSGAMDGDGRGLRERVDRVGGFRDDRGFGRDPGGFRDNSGFRDASSFRDSGFRDGGGYRDGGFRDDRRDVYRDAGSFRGRDSRRGRVDRGGRGGGLPRHDPTVHWEGPGRGGPPPMSFPPPMNGPPPNVSGPPPPNFQGPPPGAPPMMHRMPPPPGPGAPPYGLPPPGMPPPMGQPPPGMPPGMPPVSSRPPPPLPGLPSAHLNPAFFPGPPPYAGEYQASEIPPMSDAEFEDIMARHRTISSSAISRAVNEAAAGNYPAAIESLVTAISMIKSSKIAKDERCKILVVSLQDTLHGIETKSYGSSSRAEKRTRSRSPIRERERDRRDRRDTRRRERSRSRDREYDREYRDGGSRGNNERERDRSRERERYHDDRYSSSSSHRERDYRDRDDERSYRDDRGGGGRDDREERSYREKDRRHDDRR